MLHVYVVRVAFLCPPVQIKGRVQAHRWDLPFWQMFHSPFTIYVPIYVHEARNVKKLSLRHCLCHSATSSTCEPWAPGVDCWVVIIYQNSVSSNTPAAGSASIVNSITSFCAAELKLLGWNISSHLCKTRPQPVSVLKVCVKWFKTIRK